ncbi:disease resistance At4g27190-like [Olea europaea subsp. europaea]|uniref:Disease resistance At4g27190-like n=1 Tax=Olea europaea subsp. europaea TaxID=158383 RepID=A0A8S0TH05_OLEEU|nr:disease resistance At4g27190-like [Olea europaea subsp. europaea]
MEAGNVFENMLVVIEKPKTVEHIPGASITGQKTASQKLFQTMELLINDKVRRIGICGTGGVGKSTLVKNLNNEINKMPSAQPFSVIIWATSSRETNLRRIQIQIADRLNLQVKMEEMRCPRSRCYEQSGRSKSSLVDLSAAESTLTAASSWLRCATN